MNANAVKSLSYRRLTSLFGGLLLLIFGGLYVFNVSAKTEKIEKQSSPEQTLALRRLASVRTRVSTASWQYLIGTSEADGTGTHFFQYNTLNVYDPTWSPDGTKIAFSVSGVAIGLAAANGVPLGQLTNVPDGIKRNPAWSATNKVAYEALNQIWVINGDGTNPMAFPGITQPSPVMPSWSPNGGKLAFVSGGEIWTINADGTNERRVTNNTTADTEPDWSPDGTKIVFSKGGVGIVVVNLDGTNETNLTNVPGDTEPDWSPDGTKIAFRRGAIGAGGLFVMNPDGTVQVNIIADIPGRFAQGSSDPEWQPLLWTRRTLFDFDGDNKADISVFRASENKWYILQSSNASLRENVFALAGDVPVPADYDGDGKTDVAIFRPSAGAWWYLSSINGQQVNVNFGASGDIPRPSDFDGDGKTDFVLYRPSNSVWYRMSSTGQVLAPFAFGIAEDKPLIGDFDGDGNADPAIFRPSTGDWWYAASRSNNQHTVLHWGASGDIPTPADFDADGKTDFVVYRPSNGGWYILRSGEQNYTILQFGLPDDKPVVADYDGDGKADVAVFRPSTGTWYLLQTTSGFGAVQWGNSLDTATPNAFLP